MRPYSAKTAAHKRAMQAQDEAFQAEFDWCGLCRDKYRNLRQGLERHHLVGGPLRSTKGHCRENWLMLCWSCHWQHTHGGLLYKGESMPPILPGHLLWCKRKVDPSHFDLSVIKFLLRGPRCVELPAEWQVCEPHEFYIGA
jgi:hypothetical protein